VLAGIILAVATALFIVGLIFKERIQLIVEKLVSKPKTGNEGGSAQV
jgi:hypothetical protein